MIKYAAAQRSTILPSGQRQIRRIRTPLCGLSMRWVLEIGDVKRFSSIKKAISYFGVCGAQKSSTDTIKRTPLSKQRNKHLQSVLVEAAKLAPQRSPDLALVYYKKRKEGNANRATLAQWTSPTNNLLTLA